MRKMMYAGSFYPKSIDSLNKILEDCFTAKLGPGAAPVKPKNPAKPLKAVIAPHAGYSFSGMAAAWAYSAISDCDVPDLFIIIGPSHSSGRSGVSMDTFETPLGSVRSDQEFIKAFSQKGTVRVDEELHIDEHSIEVQLPFLQFALGNRAEKIKIMPFLVSHDLDLDKAARDLIQTMGDLKRSVTFIVSSDFTHYGRNYHYVPFSSDVPTKIAELDGQLFEFIKSGDYKGFEEHIFKTGATVCGALAIGLLLRVIKFNKANLEQYYTSGELSGDYKNSVSYASFVFK
jgi:MEMO1 family protein